MGYRHQVHKVKRERQADNNPYKRCLIEAEQAASKKRLMATVDGEWWRNIYKLVDTEDVLYPTGEMRKDGKIESRAREAFRSHWNFKSGIPHYLKDENGGIRGTLFGQDVERDALTNIVSQSLAGYKRQTLTKSQQQTLVLAREAKQEQVNTAKHLAQSLGISERSAKRRVASIVPKTATIPAKTDIIQIEQVNKATSRTCAWCGKPTPRGDRALCWDDHKRFMIDEDYGTLTRKEVHQAIAKSNRIHWQSVQETLKAA